MTTTHRLVPRLHQPWRVCVALVELIMCVVLVIVSVWLWRNSALSLEIPSPVANKPALVVHYLRGQWSVASVAAATIAGILLLNAIRQWVLAIRIRQSQ